MFNTKYSKYNWIEVDKIMATGSKKVRKNAAAFKAEQAKLYKRKVRQVKIKYLKSARKRGR